MNRSDNQQDSIAGPAADLIVPDAQVWISDETSPEAEAVAILGRQLDEDHHLALVGRIEHAAQLT